MEEHYSGFSQGNDDGRAFRYVGVPELEAFRLNAKVLGKTVTLVGTLQLLDRDSAQDMLSRQYGQQRTANNAHVDRLAQAMYAGEFIDAVVNPIFISDTGKLLDGQHRLLALTQTNKTIPFLVVEGLPEETFVYIDQNKTRSAKDAVKIGGVRNASKVASVAKLIYQLMEGKTRNPRNELIVRMVEDHPDLEQSVAQAEAMSDNTHITTSVGGTLYFLYSRWWPEECKKFFDVLNFGDQNILAQRNHPITRLKTKLKKVYRERRTSGRSVGLLESAVQGSHGGTVVYDGRWRIMMYIQQAFKSYRTGRRGHYPQWSWSEDQGIIDEIAELCRKTVTLRSSYSDAPIVRTGRTMGIQTLEELDDLPY